MSYEVPTSDSVTKLLSLILGDNLKTTEHDPSASEDKFIATFIDREDKLVAVCASDLPFASYSGAALAMIPPDVAKECIKDGALSDSLSDNFYEIMNICSKLMLSESSDHLRLDKAYAPTETPDGVTELQAGSTKCGFEIDIPRYGSGSIDFYIAA